ncbi:GPP34 family phosphoprotein [Rhodococcus sp. BP-252]|uniref:Golgi phosphoprotein 3 (GPP34) n=1 Tax=Rhodococcoides kyotonense TaxID=398843 RepID=A0A177YN96_9NOCA|nr:MULTISPECIES: GPP34 family phosphoprotein [Rhodococcus]MBY6414249.1 GPP34 family phosphoprotein [Rhodococcus sp. BP-320]MBY6419019.1 GPP34 family phosphoprotein [Rhodococcus sp. BP-321]MBY6423128.1 GPP34 family phosphoprotein [Rhodococcus sp. BP-324]MBY6429053.1 GPP34 family phosphoprotein [Rhodococcus sp. BP-323]MBY6434059.1 GPP34 family phosphoprotein [Rhodococcus sp. BP-322]
MTLIAEDVFVLLVDDVSGRPIVDSTKFPRVLAGAVVLELAMSGAVRLTGKGEQVKDGRLVVSGPPPQDELLARAHAFVGTQKNPPKPQKVIEKLQRNLNKELGSRLAAQGSVIEERKNVLGLFPTTTWPARDTTHENRLRQWIGSAIVDGTTPTAPISALISLLSAVDAIHKVLPGVDKKAAKKRAKEIAEGDWAGAAVRKAVQDVNAAVMTAIIVPAVVAGSS